MLVLYNESALHEYTRKHATSSYTKARYMSAHESTLHHRTEKPIIPARRVRLARQVAVVSVDCGGSVRVSLLSVVEDRGPLGCAYVLALFESDGVFACFECDGDLGFFSGDGVLGV